MSKCSLAGISLEVLSFLRLMQLGEERQDCVHVGLCAFLGFSAAQTILQSFLSAFLSKSPNHQLCSFNSGRPSALFHPTPLLWSVMGIAAWLHAGASFSAGVTVKLSSNSCPLPLCQCTAAGSGHKLHRSFTVLFLMEKNTV